MSVFPVLGVLTKVLVGIALLWAGLSLIYHYALAIAGRKQSPPSPKASCDLRFAVLIPAHNEASVVASTVNTVRQSNYPREHFDTYVIADNCSDATPDEARRGGAVCLERAEEPRGRKAYPLRWAIEQVLAANTRYDAVVVMDADSLLDAAFLSLMRDGLASGHQVLQGRHLLSNVGASSYTLVADADMRINNLLRNQAKRNLGLSARLMGDAMCFSRDVLERFGWPVDSLGEDREFGIYLVARGYRVHYIPEAISRGQAALRWGDANAQRLRWQAGADQLRRSQLGDLVRAVWTQRSLSALDLVSELVLPSFSLVTMIPVASLLLLALLGNPLVLSLGRLALVELALATAFPFFALASADAPRSSYKGVILGPAFVAWRILQKIRTIIRPASVKWVRTVRSEESKS